VRTTIQECVEVFLSYAASLRRREVPASELAYTTNLSKAPDEYTTMTVQHAAIKQLTREGASLHAGEGIRYVIADYKGRDSKRATPLDMIEDQARYDSGRYIRLLAETCSSVLEPFDPRCDPIGLMRTYEARESAPLTS
ncbi:MAG TPA: DNA polymerase domain-containing protein, partial [Nitrososphaerales archaeon]|nr:DNA polymerase domain-containing protein [Nitrososphaerales archaeon]